MNQVIQQAAFDAVTLTDFEKSLLRFSEPGDTQEEDEGAEDFDSEEKVSEYEAKISRLLKRAHKRLKREHSPQVLEWKESLSTLKDQDA